MAASGLPGWESAQPADFPAPYRERTTLLAIRALWGGPWRAAGRENRRQTGPYRLRHTAGGPGGTQARQTRVSRSYGAGQTKEGRRLAAPLGSSKLDRQIR